MTESEQIAVHHNDEIDLRELFRALWAGKLLVSGIASIVTVFAVVVSLMLPDVYRAEALLAPGNEDSRSGLSALAAQYGGLASLAGINLSNGSANDAALGIKVLRSRKFIADYVVRHDILVDLMAAEGWNRSRDLLDIDADQYDESAATWVRDVGPPRNAVPSLQEAYKEFTGLLSISEDSQTGFITIAIEHYSPHIAKQWVDWLVEDINLTMMTKDVAEAEHAIAYLNDQISATSIAGLQSVFFRLIEEQTKTVMLAKVSPEYTFKTIDPAVAPEEKFKPKRALIAILGMALGGILGVVVVLTRMSLAPKQG